MTNVIGIEKRPNSFIFSNVHETANKLFTTYCTYTIQYLINNIWYDAICTAYDTLIWWIHRSTPFTTNAPKSRIPLCCCTFSTGGPHASRLKITRLPSCTLSLVHAILHDSASATCPSSMLWITMKNGQAMSWRVYVGMFTALWWALYVQVLLVSWPDDELDQWFSTFFMSSPTVFVSVRSIAPLRKSSGL